MKRALLLLAVAGLVSSVGCNTLKKNPGCQSCGAQAQAQGGGGQWSHWSKHHNPAYFGPQPGAPSAPQVGYPYYTTRGPRDFLAPTLPPIGG